MKTNEEVDKLMLTVYPEWRYRWCEAEICGCMGCVNRSGGKPVTKEEWQDWVRRNPKEIRGIVSCPDTTIWTINSNKDK